jgi:hypothetical protein
MVGERRAVISFYYRAAAGGWGWGAGAWWVVAGGWLLVVSHSGASGAFCVWKVHFCRWLIGRVLGVRFVAKGEFSRCATRKAVALG